MKVKKVIQKGSKIAIYPGTFDPITKGHLDIIQRASKLFDKLIVAIAENKQKQPLFSLKKRLEMLQEVISANKLSNVTASSFKGLLIDFAKKENSFIIIRGLRAVSDFEYEFQMACINAKLRSDLETVFLPASDEMHFISSRFVKSIWELKGDVSKFVPKEILKYMKSS